MWIFFCKSPTPAAFFLPASSCPLSCFALPVKTSTFYFACDFQKLPKDFSSSQSVLLCALSLLSPLSLLPLRSILSHWHLSNLCLGVWKNDAWLMTPQRQSQFQSVLAQALRNYVYAMNKMFSCSWQCRHVACWILGRSRAKKKWKIIQPEIKENAHIFDFILSAPFSAPPSLPLPLSPTLSPVRFVCGAALSCLRGES